MAKRTPTKNPQSKNKTPTRRAKQTTKKSSYKWFDRLRKSRVLIFVSLFALVGISYLVLSFAQSYGSIPDKSNQLILSYEIDTPHGYSRDKLNISIGPQVLLYGDGRLLCNQDTEINLEQPSNIGFNETRLNRQDVETFVSTIRKIGFDSVINNSGSEPTSEDDFSYGRIILLNTSKGYREASTYSKSGPAEFLAMENYLNERCQLAANQYIPEKLTVESVSVANAGNASLGNRLSQNIQTGTAKDKKTVSQLSGQQSAKVINEIGKGQSKVHPLSTGLAEVRYVAQPPEYDELTPFEGKNQLEAAAQRKTRWLWVTPKSQTPNTDANYFINEISTSIRSYYRRGNGYVGKEFDINYAKAVSGSKTAGEYKKCPAGSTCGSSVMSKVAANLYKEFRMSGYSINIVIDINTDAYERCWGWTIRDSDNLNNPVAVSEVGSNCGFEYESHFIPAHEFGHTLNLRHVCDQTLMDGCGVAYPHFPDDWYGVPMNKSHATILKAASPYFDSYVRTRAANQAADFNGDSFSDVFLYGPGAENDAIWYGSNASTHGEFTSVNTTTNGTNYIPVNGDFNGDGKTDILFYGPGSTTDTIKYGSATHGVFDNYQLAITGSGYQPIGGDFNGDGNDDIFFYGPGDIPDSIWYGTSYKAEFTKSSRSVSGTNYLPVAGDFNGDRVDDIFFYGPGETSDNILYGTRTKGSFSSYARPVNGNYVPIPGDFDKDGYGDILFYGALIQPDRILYGTSTKNNFVSIATTMGNYAKLPIAGDFNGDGHGDILTYGPGVISEYLYLGTSTRGIFTRSSARNIGGRDYVPIPTSAMP